MIIVQNNSLLIHAVLVHLHHSVLWLEPRACKNILLHSFLPWFFLTATHILNSSVITIQPPILLHFSKLYQLQEINILEGLFFRSLWKTLVFHYSKAPAVAYRAWFISADDGNLTWVFHFSLTVWISCVLIYIRCLKKSRILKKLCLFETDCYRRVITTLSFLTLHFKQCCCKIKLMEELLKYIGPDRTMITPVEVSVYQVRYELIWH